jgi:hypothetical protein
VKPKLCLFVEFFYGVDVIDESWGYFSSACAAETRFLRTNLVRMHASCHRFDVFQQHTTNILAVKQAICLTNSCLVMKRPKCF